MALDLLYRLKKDLKASIGKPLKYRETSIFGQELKYDNMEGKPQKVVGGNYHSGCSSWYASVTVIITNGRPIIQKVS